MTKITLTAEEVEVCKHFGMTLIEYAHQKAEIARIDAEHQAWLQTPAGVKFMAKKIVAHEKRKKANAARMREYRAKKKAQAQ